VTGLGADGTALNRLLSRLSARIILAAVTEDIRMHVGHGGGFSSFRWSKERAFLWRNSRKWSVRCFKRFAFVACRTQIKIVRALGLEAGAFDPPVFPRTTYGTPCFCPAAVTRVCVAPVAKDIPVDFLCSFAFFAAFVLLALALAFINIRFALAFRKEIKRS
jgi:hypothetical protein